MGVGRNTVTPYQAVGIAEGLVESESDEQEIEAWQYLIDTGMAWTLQGYFGRVAEALIEQEICTPQTKGKEQ